jgi:hypothetical protein
MTLGRFSVLPSRLGTLVCRRPIFVTFGTLTAVMIVFSLLVVACSRTGAERLHFLDLAEIAPEEYQPHARDTGLAGQDVEPR